MACNTSVRSWRREVDSLKEVVLSLDGGGIRGYSSLLIIEALMDEVDMIERQYIERLSHPVGGPLTPTSTEEKVPLPAHYFDYAVGTSTGGLIAIMLGRLRMPVENCLKEYEKFGHKIFGKKRFLKWNQYSHRNFEKVIKEVVQQYSGERQNDNVLMRQPNSPDRRCRTAVMTVRRNPAAGDEANIIRSYSYSFTGRPLPTRLDPGRPLNPDGHGNVYIWQAARATSAAPHFFHDIEINGNRFMDGGVKINNPSFRAWKEAEAMHQAPDLTSPTAVRRNSPVGLFVSVGTGKSAPLTMFNERNVIRQVLLIGKAAIKRLSDPEDTHSFVQDMADRLDVPYFRFNVVNGLEDMKMDECKPDTFHKIKDATRDYLRDSSTKKQLRDCAEILVAFRRGRNPTEDERQLQAHAQAPDVTVSCDQCLQPVMARHGSQRSSRFDSSYATRDATPELGAGRSRGHSRGSSSLSNSNSAAASTSDNIAHAHLAAPTAHPQPRRASQQSPELDARWAEPIIADVDATPLHELYEGRVEPKELESLEPSLYFA